ncbi:MAG: symmetrical bis(5'-nucleosyl)-tetraphosphatase [Gammaproteobacteria bacterium]|nr:symmetrical bis(5'-nucleosyl)-tetraphosphatase [Gammaproteobacteria bacterium]
MAHYAIGDVQGCRAELLELLESLRFDPAADTLWFTGDLVNRGPESLATLRLVRELGERAVTVLGNHDLHLLAVAAARSPLKRKDTLQAVLDAPDRDELLEWLAERPLLHHDAGLGVTLLHAGLPPQWSLDEARARAAEVEQVLRDGDRDAFFGHMYGDTPDRWDPGLTGWERLRFITNCLTRLRFCTAEGRMNLASKGPPGSQPPGFMPWFDVPGRASAGSRVVCGHWSALGLVERDDLLVLDTGCLWGGTLTAVRLDPPGGRWQVDCRGVLRPG